jgi:hypothetical protein
MKQNHGNGLTDKEVEALKLRPELTVAEVAFILDVSARTVRTYFNKPSDARPGEPLLKAFKRDTLWYIKREDFENYMKEVFGAPRTS